MTICGTRPELIRLSILLKKIDTYFDHIFVHTGQNYDYELNEIFFKQLNLKHPDYYLKVAGKSVSETIGRTIMNIDPIFDKEKPDALLVLGDGFTDCGSPIVIRPIPKVGQEQAS